jgi:hypothetical protein
MLLLIAFACFAVLLASWLVLPDRPGAPASAPVRPEPAPAETTAIPARA